MVYNDKYENIIIDDIESLEKFIVNYANEGTRYRHCINVHIGEGEKCFYHGESTSPTVPVIYGVSKGRLVIHPSFYNKYKDRIEVALYKNGELRKALILEGITNYDKNDKRNKELSLSFDKYSYDEDFIMKVLFYEKKRYICLMFDDIRPSKRLVSLLKKRRVTLYFIKDSEYWVNMSDSHWLEGDIADKSLRDNDPTIFTEYNVLRDGIPNLDLLMNMNTIYISNMTDYFSRNFSLKELGIKRENQKIEINDVYLDGVFEIVKMLREKGYKKEIVISCDSVLDIARSKFLYEPLGAKFGDYEQDIDKISNLVIHLKKEASEFDTSKMSFSEKLNSIFLIVLRYSQVFGIDTKEEENIRKKIHVNDYINFFIKDLFKLFGLKPISAGKNNYLFLEKNNPNVQSFNPVVFNSAINLNDIDSNDAETWEKMWNLLVEKYNELYDVKSEIFGRYLSCESVSEIMDIYLSRVDPDEFFVLDELEPYEHELGFLLNILMDLSPEEYIKYKAERQPFNTQQDVIESCRNVASTIMELKRKEIGITVTVNKQVKPSGA